MGITVLDGSESPNLTLSTTLDRVQADIGLSASAVAVNNIRLDRALDPVVSNIVLNSTPPGSSFDWTHGLGALRLNAEDTMSSRWGVGAAGTTIIDSVADLEAYRTFRTWFSTLGDYITYQVDPASNYDRDLFIDFRGVNTALTIPIHIGKWRHVIILGVGLDLIVQSTSWLLSEEPSSTRGNEQWTCANKDYNGTSRTNWIPGRNLSQVTDDDNLYQNNPGGYPSSFDSARLPYKGWNIHPRIAGATGIRWAHSGYAWIEGVNLDCNGQQGDGMISALDSGLTATQANATKRFYVQNTRITNYDGQSTHRNYGDGIHGDSLHSQNGCENSSYWENIVVRSGQEGNVHTSWTSPARLQYHFARNYQYTLLPPATNVMNLSDYSPPGEKSSGAVISNPFNTKASEGERDQGGKWLVQNLHCANKSTNILKFSDGQYNAEHSEVSLGTSPIDFAPVSQTGVNYNSSPSNSYFNTLS